MAAMRMVFWISVVVIFAVLQQGCGGGCNGSDEPRAAVQEAAPAPAVSEADAGMSEAPVPEVAAVEDEDGDEWWSGPVDLWENNDHNDLQLYVDSDPVHGIPPLTVNFTVEALGTEESITELKARFAWDFGDGSPISHELSPTHTYDKVGEYEVTCKAIDVLDRLGYGTTDIDVYDPESRMGKRFVRRVPESSTPSAPASN